MKAILGVLLLVSVALADRRKVLTSAFLGSYPITNFLRDWHPNGFPANNDFTYTLNVPENKKVELTCTNINIEEPCSENVFRIIDGDVKEDMCGSRHDYTYKSSGSSLSVQLLSGTNSIKSTPECSAKPVN